MRFRTMLNKIRELIAPSASSANEDLDREREQLEAEAKTQAELRNSINEALRRAGRPVPPVPNGTSSE